MESLDLADRTRIGVMNPFLQRKPKRQRTGAVQDLAEARKHVALACVLECGSPLPLSDERFMEAYETPPGDAGLACGVILLVEKLSAWLLEPGTGT
jgi:hypothetical protein